ncbi:MAG: hypothetical protein Q7S50_03395 [bacterium]|nr:hypothetical protein [bacterium]
MSASHRTFISIGALLLLVLLIASLPRERAEATSGTMTGWLWSDTIGWMSLNCSYLDTCGSNNYGISVDANGNLSGYAWSDNVGWISANTSDVSGCPTSPCAPKIANGALTGWLKVLSGGSAQSGGWDGWISLNGSNYGVTFESGTFSGYAWGDVNVGWVSFALAHTTYVPNNPPDNLTISGPSSGTIDTSLEYTFTATDSDDSIHYGIDWDDGSPEEWQPVGATLASDATKVVRHAWTSGGAKTIRAVARDVIGASSEQKLYSVYIKDPCITPMRECGIDGNVHDSCTKANIKPDCSSGCYAGACSAGSISIRPLIVSVGKTATVKWNLTDVDPDATCSIVGTNGQSWGVSSLSGARPTYGITGQTTYTLSCGALKESATVNILPIFQER